MTEGPGVSVVVASFCGEAALGRCLASLSPQASGGEVIVATAVEVGAPLRDRFPLVRFVEAPEGTSVFRLRSLGVRQARGRLVALTEDHCEVAPDWLRRLAAAHGAGHRVVGGPVDNALPGIFAWALFLVEYGVLLPPLPEGPGRVLSGVNAAYARESLEACRSTWEEAFHENEVHDALRAEHGLHCVEAAWVRSHLRIGLREALAHLFRGGRQFGAYRGARIGQLKRLTLALAAPLVPGLLLWRIVKALARRRPSRLLTLLLGLPIVMLLLVAWSAGEVAGGLLAQGGPSLLRGQERG